MRNRSKVFGAAIAFAFAILALCSACDDRISYDSADAPMDEQGAYGVNPNSYQSYEIDGQVRGTANLYVGTVDPGTMMPQMAFFRYVGNHTFQPVEIVGSGSLHYWVYQDTLYYFGDYSSLIYAISGVKNDELQQRVTIRPKFGDDRYEFQRILAIQNDWIYIEAEKWGTNEVGNEVFLPGYYLAIHVNGVEWKEVTESEIPEAE